MRLVPTIIYAGLLALGAAPATASPTAKTKGISTPLYDRIVHFLEISQACYAGDTCNLAGLPRMASILNTTTDIHGWLLRDDSTKELVVVFRGTSSQINLDQDKNYTLAAVDTLPTCVGCKAHGGYYLDWVSVIDQVKGLLKNQTEKYPNYGLVVTGHSLGASMAALCAAHVKTWYSNVTVYTYGEPRTGNQEFASFLDKQFTTGSLNTTRFFRVTHEDDGIVTVPPTAEGYVHQGLELWSRDPAGPENTYVCGGETLDCGAGAGGSGINANHITYFGVKSGTCST